VKASDDVNYWKGNIQQNRITTYCCKSKGLTVFFCTDYLKRCQTFILNNLAEFTYSENLPEGFTCEIIARRTDEPAPEIKEKSLPLSKVIKSNIKSV
jgi:hypothetical protein